MSTWRTQSVPREDVRVGDVLEWYDPDDTEVPAVVTNIERSGDTWLIHVRTQSGNMDIIESHTGEQVAKIRSEYFKLADEHEI